MRKKDVLNRLKEYCHCRVKPSPISGVGLFAIHDIPEGKSIFGPKDLAPQNSTHFFTHLQLKQLPEEVREILYDYYFITNTGLHLSDFGRNHPHLASYMNHSKEPNVKMNIEIYEFFAMRDIIEGEELVCDHETDLLGSELTGGHFGEKYKLKFLEQ